MRFPSIDRNFPQPLIGLSVSYPAPGIIERIGPDWDWIWIDAQHGELDLRDAIALVRAAQTVGKPGVVRVPAQDAAWILKVLDAGAAGVIVPMVETVAEAQAIARTTRFPPTGNRSYGGRRVIDFMGRSYYRSADQDTVLILQIESSDAVDAADAIAAVAGVDGLFLGPDDLMIRSGHDVDAAKTAETIGEAARQVAVACRRHRKFVAGIGVTDAMLKIAKELRFELVVGGSDVKFLAAQSAVAAKRLRSGMQ